MTIEDLQIKLTQLFHKDIIGTSLKNNEVYLEVNPERIREICGHLSNDFGYILISLFAMDERTPKGCFSVYYVFADRSCGELIIVSIAVDPSHGSFPSISIKVPAAALYEREIHDLFGLNPIGHPDAKRMVFHGNWPKNNHPLRKDFPGDFHPELADEKMEFKKITGEGVFEIPVGPVHAGIIEPGHFRFSLAGEPILNLEAQLYFVHKGIEKLCEGKSIEQCFYISERISGDETFSNSLAYCQAIEKIAGVKVPARAEYSRVLFAELERFISHLADLSGVCGDVAYGFAVSQFSMIRNWSQALADQLCGMRFLRSVNIPGGIRKEFIAGKEENLKKRILELKNELEDTYDIVMHNSLFIDRVENTGILKNKIAVDLNAVGPGGRASGIGYDVRKAFPYAAYSALDFKVPVQNDGDVSSRVKVKFAECFESLSLMLQVLEKIPAGAVNTEIGNLPSNQCAFSMTESPRGENIHFIMTGENQTLLRYKIRTASFCNWPALCHAVQGNIVPDFPLINKSFNLSYAGNDL